MERLKDNSRNFLKKDKEGGQDRTGEERREERTRAEGGERQRLRRKSYMKMTGVINKGHLTTDILEKRRKN